MLCPKRSRPRPRRRKRENADDSSIFQGNVEWDLIITLTINPAVDRTVLADRLVFEDRSYILSRKESAGGRGINASAVIHSFGGQTLAIATCGGSAGERFKELLINCCGYPVDLVAIRKDLRTNLTITDKQGLTVKLNEAGPELEPDEVKQIEQTVFANLIRAEWLMLCGSLPPGVPHDFYSKLITESRKRGVKTLLDTDGEALLEGIEAGPTVVSPNQAEAERLLNQALLTRSHYLDAAERIRAMGAESVLLSLGSRGAVGALDGELLEILAPRIDAVSPIGSGDAMAAAFVWAAVNGGNFAESARWGVATGTASAQLPGTSFASLEQARVIYDQVRVRAAK
jgi:1-phosphofructokinase family hexose kinase